MSGIDILETGAGRAIDELVVSLPDEDLVPLLVKEIQEVEDVDVEDVRRVEGELPDARVAALESAAELLAQPDVASVCEALVKHVRPRLRSRVGRVVPRSGTDDARRSSSGDAPTAEWLAAFLAGSGGTGLGEQGPDDVAWAALTDDGAALVIGRTGRPFRARERRQLSALAKIVGWRLTA